ncbi:hypothetical protein TARUN_4680 [Trichoderma arundinaceum]|uniref:2EXR domain-containing protein n=1 Tax=Trichoderma arundinaceum TaxID=490622 RepID=A0A395NNQ2_TRIAR|nr:hypothetical protein TARUN_4680 [Trichoderma arundinaceum]
MYPRTARDPNITHLTLAPFPTSTGPSTFPRFSRLPTEIRLKIWRACLPELDGIALHTYKVGCWTPRPRPSDRASGEQPQAAPVVPIAPVAPVATNHVKFDFCHDRLDDIELDLPLVFVSREARAATLAWAAEKGIEKRFCEERQCHIFVEPFDAVNDSLFIGVGQWDDFFAEPYQRLAQPDLLGQTVVNGADLTRMALAHTTIWGHGRTLLELLHWFPALEVIFIVMDVQIGLGMAEGLHKANRGRTVSRLRHQRWKVGQARGRSLVWDSKDGKFNWEDGVDICSRATCRQMEDLTKGVESVLADRKDVGLEIVPVFAVKGT